jgi:hypothetical protein
MSTSHGISYPDTSSTPTATPAAARDRPHRHRQETPRILYSRVFKIIADVKQQAILANLHGVVDQQRAVGAAIAVGDGFGDEYLLAIHQFVQLDAHPPRGFAAGGVEHMGCEFSGHEFLNRAGDGPAL